jgi:hypothetical protein
MNNKPVRRRLRIAVAMAAATSATLLAWVYANREPLQPVAAADIHVAQLAGPPPSAARFEMQPLAAFADVGRRPLFAMDRRPHKPPAAPPASLAAIVLSGIIIGPEGRYAIIRDGAATKRIGEGQRLAAGTVERITLDHIEIIAGDGTAMVVKLFPPSATTAGTNPETAAGKMSTEARTQRPAAPSAAATSEGKTVRREPG